jgi:two-component system copper resistance phosphate regulon response regulator CusR
MRILVVEDDRKVASFIRQGLVEEGHTVETAADGDRGLELLVDGEPYDLIVLDVLLPGRDGFSVLKAARQAGVHAPVIMLTARDSVADKVTGLDLGADDYLAKPFAFEELLARVRALFRRRAERRTPVLRLADLTLDPATRKVERAGRRIELTTREWALLEYFMRNPAGSSPVRCWCSTCGASTSIPRATSSTCTSAIFGGRSTARRSASSSTPSVARATC